MCRRWLFNPNRPAPAAVGARPRRYEGQVGIDVDTQNKQQQIAALTIQLAWRQYIGRQVGWRLWVLMVIGNGYKQD